MFSTSLSNVLWQAATRPYVGELQAIFQDEFLYSFQDFTTSWRENCVFGFPPTVTDTFREKLSLFDNQDFLEFIEWILLYIDSNFLPFQLAELFETGYTDDEFFDILLSVLAYLEDAFKTIATILNIDTTTLEYQRKFGSVDPVTHLTKKSTEKLFKRYDDKIMNAVCRRVRILRKCHSYHDKGFWNSISRTSLGKVADVINQVPETERYGEFVQQYESELVDDVTEYVKKIPLVLSEKRFLLTMRECVDIEESVYNTLICPDVEVYDDCNTKILNVFRDQHERRRAARIFKNMDSELVNPKAKFSAAYFRDLYALYVFRGGEAMVESLRKLASIIQENFVQVVETHTIALGEAVPGLQALESFRVSVQKLSKQKKLIRARLSEISEDEDIMETLDRASSQLSLSRLSTMGYANQMRAAGNYAISFLCNRNVKTNDELMSLSLIVNYFLFIPQHARFMNDLLMKIRKMTLQRIQLPMDRLNTFSSWRHVNQKVSKKVKSLIQDLNASLGMGGNDETAFYDTSSDLRCDTCLITRSRYWGSDKNWSKLIRPWPQIAHIQERVNLHLERKIDNDRQLIPMDCMSRVVLKTTLYTRGRGFTRLDMLQHQAMVLILCEEKERVQMSAIVRSMSVEKFETENERKKAKKFIVLLVESLKCPYPLLKTTRDVASNAEDAFVSINHSFAFQEQEVRLPGDYLLLNEEICWYDNKQLGVWQP